MIVSSALRVIILSLLIEAILVAVSALPVRLPVIVPVTFKFPCTCNLFSGSVVPIPTLPLNTVFPATLSVDFNVVAASNVFEPVTVSVPLLVIMLLLSIVAILVAVAALPEVSCVPAILTPSKSIL